eukprot:jgi/Chrpa1/9242/Chrysochromulina_OHIO_Genome00016922-RA
MTPALPALIAQLETSADLGGAVAEETTVAPFAEDDAAGLATSGGRCIFRGELFLDAVAEPPPAPISEGSCGTRGAAATAAPARGGEALAFLIRGGALAFLIWDGALAATAAATAAAPTAAVLAAPPEALVAGRLVAAGQAGASS